jgi:transcription initiation factor IIE alpha subunit
MSDKTRIEKYVYKHTDTTNVKIAVVLNIPLDTVDKILTELSEEQMIQFF